MRSGLVETIHEGAVAVVDPDGVLVARHGDIDRPFFLRSSAKPFQAHVSQQAGADLSPLQLAMACASHRGFPVHIALVQSILEGAGLDEDALGCPPHWPLGSAAARIVLRGGAEEPRRIWHNCSGKHAGFLRACVAAGWPLGTYLESDHPLQQRVIDLVSEVGGYPAEPVGVDGCGAPVMRTTVRAMATMFARLGTAAELADVFTSMHRYPALVAVNGQGDAEIAMATDSAAKGGAQGCVGVAVAGRYGVGVKSWDGSSRVADLAAASVLEQLGVLSATGREILEPIIHSPVLGGGRTVGRLEPSFELETV
ncbi:MAG TPA: asparaginase [Acidimicrobiia bacterium]